MAIHVRKPSEQPNERENKAGVLDLMKIASVPDCVCICMAIKTIMCTQSEHVGGGRVRTTHGWLDRLRSRVT